MLDTSFTLVASSDFIEIQAAGTCLQASDTITVTVSHLTAPANWCLDSVSFVRFFYSRLIKTANRSY